MANALSIKVKESVQTLRVSLKKAPPHQCPKIKMLIEIKTSEFSLSKNELAYRLGVNHNSIQAWRSKYLKSGLEGLLKDGRIGFKPSLISPKTHKKIAIKLSAPEAAFSSYKQLQAWVDKNFIVGINYNSLRHYVKRHFGAKLKVPRKSHINKDKEASITFKKTSSDSVKK